MSDALLLQPRADLEKRGTIVFIHGTNLAPASYTQLASLWAEDGYVVYAPKTYTLWTPTAVEAAAVEEAAELALRTLPQPMALAGHSRGAQAVMCALLSANAEPCRAPSVARASAVLLIDPVEGRPGVCGRHRVILQRGGADWCLNSAVPILVVGGSLGMRGLTPASPPGYGYVEFWRGLLAARCSRTGGALKVFYIELQQCGHLDYVDDSRATTGWTIAAARAILCGAPGNRAAIRQFCREALDALVSGRDPSLLSTAHLS